LPSSIYATFECGTEKRQPEEGMPDGNMVKERNLALLLLL
jgi:hypothetical protein